MRIQICFILLFLTTVSYGQRYNLTTFSTNEGLPQSQVTCIEQDSKGYLWIGTLGGLARFNGKDFKVYSSKNGLLNNRITTISPKKEGIWIGHEGGVSFIGNSVVKSWKLREKDKSVRVTAIRPFKGSIVVATNGAGLYFIQKNRLVPIPLDYKTTLLYGNIDLNVDFINEDILKIRDLLICDSGLYVGSRGGLLFTKDLQHFRLINGTQEFSISNLTSVGREIYITTYYTGLCLYDGKDTSSFSQLDKNLDLKKCFFNNKNQLTVISATEVISYTSTNKISVKLSKENALPDEAISCGFEDVNGNLWLGTEGGGILKFAGNNFTYFDTSYGIPSPLVTAIREDADGKLWFGAYEGGLATMSKNKKIQRIQGLENVTIWSIALAIKGFNWIGTDQGLYQLRGDKLHKIYFEDSRLPGNKITCFLKLSNSEFLVGGSEGLSLYKNETFHRIYSSIKSTVRSIISMDKKIYCATDEGLFIIENGRVQKHKNITSVVYSLVKDDFGNLWIGSEEGLFKLAKKKLARISLSTFVASDYINFLVYKNHKVYAGTNNGIFAISQLDNTNPKVKNYGVSDGLVSLETNLNSAWIDARNNLWFGTSKGLVVTSTKSLQKHVNPPVISLEQLLINYKSIALKELKYEGNTIVMELPYWKNNLTIHLDAISLSKHSGIQYQATMRGDNYQHIPWSEDRTFTFNGLVPGNHTLTFMGVDMEGNLSNKIILEIYVAQAFYKTSWFFGLCLLLVGYLVYRIFKFTLQREREKNELVHLDYKSKLLALEQRSLNASMNRHFIFNSLNSIQYYINTQDKLSANKFLTNFARLIRKNLDSADEGNLVTLQQEIERLELYLSLEHMRFKDRFDYTILCAEEIDQESTIIPAMLLQPFVENSIIHGILPNEDKKGSITVRITNDKNLIRIQIDDNGIGIESSLTKKSTFVGDHRSQGTEITLNRLELIKKLTGKHIELEGPKQVSTASGESIGTTVILKIEPNNFDN